MGKTKQLLRGVLGLVMAAVMMLAVAPSVALAETTYSEFAGTGKIEITGLAVDDQVSAIRVAKTLVGADNTVKSQWVDGATKEWGNIDDIVGLKGELPKALANTIAATVFDPKAQFTASGTATAVGTEEAATATIENLKPGLYLIKVVSKKDVDRIYQNTLVAVNPKVGEGVEAGAWATDFGTSTMKLKFDTPKIIKEVKEGDGDYTEQIETLTTTDLATFNIAVPVPHYAPNAKDRVFKVTDTLVGDYLDVENFDGTVKVTTVDEQDEVKDVDKKYYTATYDNKKGVLTVDFTDEALQVYQGQTLNITYSVKVTGKAIAIEWTKLNDAGLDYSRDSYGHDTNTKKDCVEGKFYKLSVFKYDVDDEKKGLEGAEFTLYKGTEKDGVVLSTGKSQADGTVKWNTEFVVGKDEQLTLVETKAPAGYKPTVIPSFTVKGDGIDELGYFNYKVSNEKGSDFDLPSTGGAGTVGLTVAGVVIMVAAGAFVVRSRKQN